MITHMYKRRPAVVGAEQMTGAGTIHTEAGTFNFNPGDWLVFSKTRRWIVESAVFDELYERIDVMTVRDYRPIDERVSQ